MPHTFSPITAESQFHLDVSFPSPTRAQVVVVGELDLVTAPELCQRLLDVLENQHPAVLDVDLAGVSFMGSTGISVLVKVDTAAAEAGSQMRIIRLSSAIRRVLELVGLLDLLKATPDQLEPLPHQDRRPVSVRR